MNSSALMTNVERERRIVTLALRLATTYCAVAESHAKVRHRADTQRVLQKARKEIAAVEQRMGDHKGLFASETGAVLSQIADVKKRIEHLDRLAT